jgi:hypothetical protein
MRDPKAPVTGVPYKDVPSLPLHQFLGKDSPVDARTQALTPILFRYQARILNNEEVVLTGNVFQERLLNIRFNDVKVERDSDLPVITNEELEEIWLKSTDAEPKGHIRPLQRMIADRMTTYSGVTCKFQLMGILNTLTGELQPMNKAGERQELVQPFAWLTGHYSNTIKFGPETVGTLIDESFYRSIHLYAALEYYVNLFEGDRAMYRNPAYTSSRLYLSAKGPESNFRFRLAQRRNPDNQEAVLGLEQVSFRGFTGLGAFCGSLATEAALAAPVEESTTISFDASMLELLNDAPAPTEISPVDAGPNPLDL